MTRNILAIGAHPDDIELGCGGALIQHVLAGDNVTMLVMTRGEVGPIGDRLFEQRQAADVIGAKLEWGDLKDGRVSLYELDIVHTIERMIRDTEADLIYTHTQHDSHQDHRAIGLGTLGAARKLNTILTYEAPSAVNFRPTIYVDIAAVVDKKIEALLCHGSQVAASEMVDEGRVRAYATVRGHDSRLLGAEGFEPVRAVWHIA